MQNTRKILTLVLLCFITFSGLAQLEVRDEVLAGFKVTAAGLIAGLDVEKALIEASYRKLAVEEQKWKDKLATVPDAGITSVYMSALWSTMFLQGRIANIETKISTLEAIPPFIHRGLKEIKGSLAREKAYLDNVSNDLDLFGYLTVLSPRLTGGQGYSYTYSMKLFLRYKRIWSNVHKIDYDLSNLNVFTKVFF